MEREKITRKLFHVTAWEQAVSAKKGDELTLEPGRQNAEGLGVYFSEGAIRISAAEGASNAQERVAICIEAKKDEYTSQRVGEYWWRSKGTKYKKEGKEKPRTWHTKGSEITVSVIDDGEVVKDPKSGVEIRMLKCSYELSAKIEQGTQMHHAAQSNAVSHVQQHAHAR